MEDWQEQMPFTITYGPRFMERYELGQIDEDKVIFLETKLSEWDLMHRVRQAGCETVEEFAEKLMKEEGNSGPLAFIKDLWGR